jgi:hypothetical protein
VANNIVDEIFYEKGSGEKKLFTEARMLFSTAGLNNLNKGHKYYNPKAYQC